MQLKNARRSTQLGAAFIFRPSQAAAGINHRAAWIFIPKTTAQPATYPLAWCKSQFQAVDNSNG
jgi:hypothetical protein